MDEYAEIDISEYYKIPLDSLVLPDNYNKLLRRIKNLSSTENGFSVETVGDIVKLDPNQFFNFKGVGNNYVRKLIQFKNELPFILNRLKQEPNFFSIEDVFTSLNNNYNYDTPINQLSLSPKYKKLIKRIFALMDNIVTVQDIIDIDVADFSKLPAVGKLYVEALKILQTVLTSTNINQQNANTSSEIKKEFPSKTSLSKLYINYGFLTEKEIKSLKKLERFYDGNVDVRNVNTLLDVDKIYLSKQAGFGDSFLLTLNNLQDKIRSGLNELPDNITECNINEKGLFISSEITFIEFNEIDKVLIDDVEGYLWTLDEKEMDIALSRWGFNQKHETLEEVGSRHKLTRERIRQFEKSINSNLPLYFRIQPKIIWANIRDKMTEDLTVLLPNLAKCFATDELFYSFIELCCQVEIGSIREIVFTKISTKIINQLFCTNPSPIAQEIIINELMSNYGYSRASAIIGIKQLEKINKIEITDQGIYPNKLGRAEAVAHILTFHPAGLPWKDISRIANIKGYSSTLFDETRIASGFNDSEYIYLCDKGTYRNLMFLDLERFNISEIIQHLLNYLKQYQSKALHLHDYYFQSKGNRSEIEYFTLRHIVREYGEEYGIYFNGKSGSDSVSLDPELKRITQADVVIKVLNESKVAMTKQEIAERLRSKSKGHAAFYINNLMEEGKVVRVDQMVYTTIEKAFRNMDTKAIMSIIKDIMDISAIIVEADIFREYVNMELSLSYSKYIYISLIKTHINDLGWYRNNSLFSKIPIPYKNLLDMCKQLCIPTLSNDENAKIIKQAAWLTDSVAKYSIQQWKLQLGSHPA